MTEQQMLDALREKFEYIDLCYLRKTKQVTVSLEVLYQLVIKPNGN